MAERINKGVRSAEEAERHARVLQEIEAHIEGMDDVRAASLCLPAPPTHLCPSVGTWTCGHVHSHSGVPKCVCIVVFSTSVSSHVTRGLTALGGGMGCCFHWPGPWSGVKGSSASGEGVTINN